ncbi:uncharacterized protein SCHCODRAFT_02287566 [Schizophyllum commune H4-8]|nr:uncharacterized protein SCHCODRAFT_02287566 [Schizophyllum commune H4-8]KAI5892265.1 hypothetical protein SCHCODRAFT_02287566 [Schizophyllum commune H4-8]
MPYQLAPLSNIFRSILTTARRPSEAVPATPIAEDDDDVYDFPLDLVDDRAGLGLGYPSTSSLSISSLAGRAVVTSSPAPAPAPVVAPAPAPEAISTPQKQKKKGIFGFVLPLFSAPTVTPASPLLAPALSYTPFDSFSSSSRSLAAFLSSPAPSSYSPSSPIPSSPTPPSPNLAMLRAAAHVLRPVYFPRRPLYDIPEEMPSPRLLSPIPPIARHRGPLLVWNAETQTFGFYRSPLLTSSPVYF